MESVVQQFVDAYGYLGLVLLIEMSPISSDIILVISGFMTSYTELKAPIIILCITCSSTIVGVILYSVGRFLDIERLMRLLQKWGKYSPVKEKDVLKIRGWFNQKGAVVVFFCRLIPGVRSVVSLPAGMIRMNFWTFLGLTISGTFTWALIAVYLGVYLGAQWPVVERYFASYSGIMVFLAIAFLAYTVFRFWKKSNR
ncbi:alkaline phosphatase [Erysipelotrichaceae bacterium]|nr:alkaline phosphatase [Erysipelotrichaceae bacterium]